MKANDVGINPRVMRPSSEQAQSIPSSEDTAFRDRRESGAEGGAEEVVE
jgi:hypothetical protein